MNAVCKLLNKSQCERQLEPRPPGQNYAPHQTSGDPRFLNAGTSTPTQYRSVNTVSYKGPEPVIGSNQQTHIDSGTTPQLGLRFQACCAGELRLLRQTVIRTAAKQAQDPFMTQRLPKSVPHSSSTSPTSPWCARELWPTLRRYFCSHHSAALDIDITDLPARMHDALAGQRVFAGQQQADLRAHMGMRQRCMMETHVACWRSILHDGGKQSAG
jgi:hypothetical protein